MGLRHSRSSSSVSALPSSATPEPPEYRSAARSSINLPLPPASVRICCPMCHAILLPPPGAPLFRCPCGVTLSYTNSVRRENEISSILHEVLGGGEGEGEGRAAGGGTASSGGQSSSSSSTAALSSRPGRPHGTALEARLQLILSQMPPLDPQAQLLRMLIARLPRDAEGIMRPEATELLGRLLERAAAEELRIDTNGRGGAQSASSSAIGGAPRSLIDLLPTRIYKKPQVAPLVSTAAAASLSTEDPSLKPPAAAASASPSAISSEHTRCQICLSDYDAGDELRTLPCIHAFHTSCVDQWLLTKKLCPICKTDITAGEERAVWDSDGVV